METTRAPPFLIVKREGGGLGARGEGGEQRGYTKGCSGRRELHAAPSPGAPITGCEPSGGGAPLRCPGRRRAGFRSRRGRRGEREEDRYLNATLSRSLRHVSRRQGPGSSRCFSTFLSSPQPRSAPRPAGRGHLRSFFQHLARQPPRGSASARGGRGGRRRRRARGGGGVGAGPSAAAGSAGHCAARRPGAQPGRPPALSSHPRPARRPPPPAVRPLARPPARSLSRMFSFLEERN